MDEPRPLIDDDRDPLARLVRHGRGLEVEYDVEAGLRVHRAAVDAGARPWSSAGSGASAWGRGVVALAIAGAGWFTWRASTEPVTTPVVIDAPAEIEASPRLAAPVAIAAPVATTPRRTPGDTASQPANAPATLSPPVTPRREPKAVATPADAAPTRPVADDRIEREAAQIRRIRGDLAAGEAAAALRGCDDGDTEFAGGVFSIEREALRVLSLFALGRRDEADASATRYLAAHPQGPLVAKIRAAAAG